jgi:hypothetical protein
MATGDPTPTLEQVTVAVDGIALERRGRSWLLWSFLLCPCHLPWTLAIAATVLGGTSLGVVVRDHAWVAGTLVTAAWVLGTAYGFRLLRRAERAGAACPTRPRRSR